MGVSVIEIEGHEIVISRPQKILFPDSAITKLDLCATTLAWPR
jgi:hypothetical protein